MTEQSQKKPTNPMIGILFIVLGGVGIASRFIGEPKWNTVDIVKLVASVLVLIYGLYIVSRKRN